jgi:integrase
MAKPHQRASDGLWAVTIELPVRLDGKRRRKTVYSKTRAGAITKARAVQKEVDRAGDMLTTSPTLARWLERWLVEIAAPNVRPRTLENYAHMVTLITPPIGRIQVDKLGAEHVRRLASYVIDDRGLSPTTAHNAHAVLRKSLNDAMAEQVTSRNIAAIVKGPQKAHYEAKYLTAEQGETLLRSVATDPRAMIRWSLALIMGMRQGECLGLRADHVDLDAGTIRVEWQLQRLEVAPRRGVKSEALGNDYHLTEPKTGAGARLLPMPAAVLEMMRRYVPKLAPDGFVCGPGITDERTDARAWKRALLAADLPEVRLHSARHTALTMLAKMGAPSHVREAIAGHASQAALKMYTHSDQDEMRKWLDESSGLLLPGGEA